MDKQAQDRLWNDLSEESKNKLREMAGLNLREGHYLIKDFEKLFGTHNLNPKPQIKTWEDVAIHKPEIWDEVHKVITTISGCSRIGNKLLNKLIATIQIQQLIELGYGGMVSEEEWKDKYKCIYAIKVDERGEMRVISDLISKHFIVFHTEQQAREFMSHESNKILVRQYYLM